jgi:acyl-ACP thioesterase
LGEEFQALYGASAGSRKANFRLGHPGPPADATRSAWRFRASDIDIAGHVNNAAYWEPVEELFMETEEPGSADVEIEYRDPAQPGDASILREGSTMWVTAADGAVHASIVGLPNAVPAG